MSRCGVIYTAGGRTDVCGRPANNIMHDEPEFNCPNPDAHHAYQPKEEPMPEAKTPKVHLATVVSTWEPDYTDNRENGSHPSVTVRLDRYTKLPRIGDRIVVSSATEGIFGWIREQTTAREDVLAAAIAWAEDGYGTGIDSYRPRQGTTARTLWDAVQRAKGLTPKPDPDDSWRWPTKEEAQATMAQAPSEADDPREGLARDVAEAIGKVRSTGEVTVIIIGELD